MPAADEPPSRHVVVLAGGLTHERDVSLRSGSRLAESLRRDGHDVTVRDADSDLVPWLASQRPDAAVIALHGGRGENGAVQGVLEMMGIPFPGTASHDCRFAWDKPTAKSLMRRAGFPTPDWFTLSHSTFRDLGASSLIELLVSSIGLPLTLKPHQGGSALGTNVVRAAGELPASLVSSFGYGEVVLVERFVTGREIAVTVIDDGSGPRALPAVEVSFPGDVFDYDARYTAGMTTYHTPARLDEAGRAAAAELAVAAHRILGLRDVSRTDAIVDESGTVQFLEVNVSPGLTETSLLPMAVEAAGESLGGLYSRLIEQAISRGKR
ncbi:D-alanine--D-alanine ligase family protein [Nakamurella lactea]|uniref:D-alanine--D-alanine ligase family protein n=1 Tax=Nakamurella lactea TaxID=459515 RepID=UPI000404751D|nr:D-alanine--D-alanine ligase [Nakamurella lactea]